MAKHVKVVQSGQGADEVFAGYHWYPPMLEPGAAGDGGVLAYAAGVLRPARRGDGRGRRPPRTGAADDVSRGVRRRALRPARAPTTPIDRALRIDTEVMLVDDPVKRVDNMTMAWGLEARVPFLDHELVELAGRLPARAQAGPGRQGRAQGGWPAG